jgi:hypothetical protein
VIRRINLVGLNRPAGGDYGDCMVALPKVNRMAWSERRQRRSPMRANGGGAPSRLRGDGEPRWQASLAVAATSGGANGLTVRLPLHGDIERHGGPRGWGRRPLGWITARTRKLAAAAVRAARVLDGQDAMQERGHRLDQRGLRRRCAEWWLRHWLRPRFAPNLLRRLAYAATALRLLSHRAGAARPQRRFDHDGVHARAQPGRQRSAQPARPRGVVKRVHRPCPPLAPCARRVRALHPRAQPWRQRGTEPARSCGVLKSLNHPRRLREASPPLSLAAVPSVSMLFGLGRD